MTQKKHTLGRLLGLTAAGAMLQTLAHADLIGHWAFDEASGTTAMDSSARGNDGVITGATWGTDALRASYLIFNGTDTVVDPSLFLPVMTEVNDFTWSVWVNNQLESASTQPNAIVLGNRYDATGVDFVPRQFTKLTPTKFEWHQNGNGNDNLEAPDLDFDAWRQLTVVKSGTNLEYYFDGVSIGTNTLGELMGGAALPFFIGGQSGVAAAGEFFNGFIDDIRLYDEALDATAVADLVGDFNFKPRFTASPRNGTDATVDIAYTGSIADWAIDANAGDTLTYTKDAGAPAWLSVAPDGTLGGTPTAADAGPNSFTIEVSDGTQSAFNTLVITIIDPNAKPPEEGVFGRWPLNDGTGNIAADTSGHNLNATISNGETGGLGDGGSVWVEDPERGTVLSFNGTNGSGAFATVGAPPLGSLPILTLEQDFSWSFWAKSDQAANNDIIIGNRKAPDGSEFTPREFVKFTTRGFEYDASAAGHITLDYEDLLTGIWLHHAVVKAGASLTYYRDGQELLTDTIFTAQVNPQPLYFGGFGSENWRGYLSDVNLFDRALSSVEIMNLFDGTPLGPVELEITDISINESGDISLTWTSRDNATYGLFSSDDLSDWQEIQDGINSQGASTTVTLLSTQFPLNTNPSKIFFRATLAE